MAKDTIVSSSKLTAIADAINEKTGKSASMTLDEMAEEIAAIETGGGGEKYLTCIKLICDGDFNRDLDLPAEAGILHIPESFMYERTVRSVKLPSGITSIGKSAFYNCQASSINIPATVTTIDEGAFSNAFSSSGDIDVVIPDACTTLARYAFSAAHMTSIKFGSGITKLLAGLCQNATRLRTVHIPSTVTQLVNAAFYNCSALTDVYIYSTTAPSLASSGAQIFPNRSTLKFHFYTGADIAAIKASTNWAALSSCTFVADITEE